MEKAVNWLSGSVALAFADMAAVSVAFYAGLAVCGLFWGFPENRGLIIFLGLGFGVIREVGRGIGQEKMADGAMAVIFILLLMIFAPRGYGWEIAISLPGFSLLSFLQRDKWLGRGFFLCLFALAVAAFFMGRSVSAALAGALMVLGLKELVGLYGRENGVRMLPFLLCVECVALCFPISAEPIDWSFVVRLGSRVTQICQTVIVEVQYLMADAGFTALHSGYGNLENLGGGLAGNSREDLYLERKCTRGNLYLGGKEYISLDGMHWEEGEGEAPPASGWYVLYLNALCQNGITKEETECFSQVCTAEITYGYLRTKDLLHPSYVLRFKGGLADDLTENTGEFSLRKRKGRGYQYQIQFMEFDLANPYLRELLRKGGGDAPVKGHGPSGDYAPDRDSIPGGEDSPFGAQAYRWEGASYEEMDACSRELYGLPLDPILPEKVFLKWKDRLVQAGEGTLEVPDATERTRALALEITEGCESDLDKCLAVESYLRQYPYARDVDLRKYEDYIDAFLFEEQKGYCIHYASAMVELLRLVGVPARLREGYCCHYTGMRPDGSYPVMGDDAHAWPEAYIEGFGWVPFEPTAVMEDAWGNAWNLRLKPEAGAAMALEEKEEEPEQKKVSIPEQIPEEEEGEGIFTPFHALVFLVFMVSILGLFLCGLMVKRSRYRRKGGLGKLEADLEDIKWMIRSLYPGEWKGALLLDHAAVLEDETLKDGLRQVCFSYYRARYGGGALTDEEQEAVVPVKKAVRETYLTAAGGKKMVRRILLAVRSEGQ